MAYYGAWDLEEKLGQEFPICSFPAPLQERWLAERAKKHLKQRSDMQFIDFHNLNKSLRDNISTNYSTWMMDVLRLMQEQQDNYSKEREGMKVAYEQIIQSLLDGEMSIEEGKTRIVMSADGVEVLDPEPKDSESE